jgi:signal transduction histidine kinase
MRLFSLLALTGCFWLSLTAAPASANGGEAAFAKTVDAAKAAMMADPQDALKQVEVALKQSEALSGRERQIARATALWLKIEANIRLNRLDVAQEHLDEAIELAKASAPETKLHGDLMRSKGAVVGLGGKASEALRHYLEAHRIFRNAKEKRSQAIALQDIGQIYWEAGDYGRMLAYYDDAQEIYDDDPAFALSGNNNRGEAYRILGRREEAEKAYSAALANARAMQSPMLETRILSNLALVQVEMGKLNLAARNAALAERLGANEEARDWLPFVYGVKAKIAASRGDDRQSALLLDKLFASVDLNQTDLTYKEFHKLAADLYTRLGQSELALRHLQSFQRLDSEARDLVTSTSSQLLSARFDSANQKTRIAQLKQGQLQRDIEIERQKRTITTGLLIAAFGLIIIVGIAFLSIRKSRNQVRDTNEVLTDVNAKLEFALKAKTDFLAMTSHEIRTPLNGIMGMTQVILADDRIDRETRERVSLVMGAGQTMQSLVDDLLDVAKMENGAISVKTEPTNLRGILHEGVQLWQAEASAKGIQIEFVEEAVPAIVHTDGGRVRQVIFNLLANAIKFTSDGSVRLTARSVDAGKIEILVEDSGIGIPENQLQQVFEPFHQVDSAMSRDFGGAGLGLAICRNIMTALGGTIDVTSVVGQGSCFHISLPVAGNASDSADAGDTANRGSTLIVDGNELRIAKLKAVLQPHVGSVAGTKSLADALSLLNTGSVSLLVFDTAALDQEEMRLGALSKIIALAKVKNVPTILLLAADDKMPLETVQALEPDALLQKPLKASLLVEAARKAMQLKGFQSAAA